MVRLPLPRDRCRRAAPASLRSIRYPGQRSAPPNPDRLLDPRRAGSAGRASAATTQPDSTPRSPNPNRPAKPELPPRLQHKDRAAGNPSSRPRNDRSFMVRTPKPPHAGKCQSRAKPESAPRMPQDAPNPWYATSTRPNPRSPAQTGKVRQAAPSPQTATG